MARNAAELSLSSSSCSSLSSKDPTAHSSSWAASSDENRTVRIVYYLSRGGLLEQPHLLEVPLSAPQSGLTLRDVKKKLMSIRGKAMPAAFAWSYKRSYRNGYVWQDLCGDGDLIFPPSANQSEYIIKGCKLSHSTCYIRKSEEESESDDDDGDGDENDGELVDEDQELGQDHDQQRSSYSYGIRNGTSKHNKFHTKNSVDDEDYEEENDHHHHHRLSSASKSKNSIIISPLNLSRNRRLSGANPAEVIMVKSSDAATQTEEELAALITNNNSNHFLRMNNMTSNESIMNQCTNPAADGIYHRLEPSINQCTNATNRTIINQCTNAANGTIINHRINPSINPCTNAATGTINHQRIDPLINQCTNATTGTINHQRIDPSINQCTNAGNGRINPRINPSIKLTGSNHSNNHHHDHCDHHDPMRHVTMPSPSSSSSPRRGATVLKNENRNSNVISNEVDVISRKLGQINTTMPSSSNPNTALNCSNNSGGAPSSSSNHRMMIDQGASSSGSNEHRRIDQTYRPSSNYLSRYARPDHDRDEMIINGKAGGGLVLMNHNHNYKHNSPKSAINLPNNRNNNTKTAGNNCYLQERQDEKKFVSSGDGEYLVTLSPNSLDQKCNKLCNNSLGNLLHNWVSSCGGIINGLEDQVKNQEPMIRYDTRIIKHFNTNEDCNKPIGINDTVTVASKRFSFKSMKGLHNLISVLIKKDHYYNNNHNVVGDFKATVNDGRFEFCNRNQVVVNADENCGTSSRRFSIGELIRAADDSPLRSSSGSLTDQYFFMRSCHDDDHRNNDIMNNIKRKS